MTPHEIADELVRQWSYDVASGTVAGAAAYLLLRDRIAQVLGAHTEPHANDLSSETVTGLPPSYPNAVADVDTPTSVTQRSLPSEPVAPSEPALYRPDPSYYWGRRKPLF